MSAGNLRAGVVGLGLIGGGVAVSLTRSGMPPVVFDVRADAAEPLTGVPAQAGSAAEVARASDVVLVAVVTAEQARDVLVGDGGLLTVPAGERRELTVVLLSTVSVEAVRELAGLCAEHGATLLDAGVTGGARAADNGLVVMVGGADADVRRAMPVLGAFAQSVVHCGPLGAGMATKLARNAATYGTWAVMREAAALAATAGVPLERFLEVMDGDTKASTDPLMWLREHPLTDEQLGGVERLADKDLAAAQELAGTLNLEVPFVDVTRGHAGAVFGNRPDPAPPADQHARGRAVMDRVYGQDVARHAPDPAPPMFDFTLRHLFADIWARPYLTMRDRRLLVLGVTAMLGRADLLETQLRGALANRELTVRQLREIALLLSYYAGWGNGTQVGMVVEKLVAEQPSG